MQFIHNHKVLAIVIALITLLLIIGFVNFLYIKFAGNPVPVPTIPRQMQTFGSGRPLTLAVLGDSTAIGQGGDYQQGIAVGVAQHLAKNHTVDLQNLAISGARTHDVLQKQINRAITIKPDIVLLAVGANDVTHLTNVNDVTRDMQTIIHKLQTANKTVDIVLTGSPQMGAVPRFLQPIKYVAKLRTATINKVISNFADNKTIFFAPIAQETGDIFAKNPHLFAADKFHPNNMGYEVWKPVLYLAIDKAIRQ